MNAVRPDIRETLLEGVHLPHFKYTDARKVVLTLPGFGWEADLYVVGDPGNGAYEWVLFKDGKVEQHSDGGYGQSSIALRDGLIALHGLPQQSKPKEPAPAATPKTTVSMTITGVPCSLNSETLFADAVVTVDFAEIAAQRICNAVSAKSKRSGAMFDAVTVKAINVRAAK